MSKDCLAVLEAFDSELPFEAYNMFGCHKLTEPLAIEEELAAVLPGFEGLDESERTTIRSRINVDLAAKLAALGLRMATMALRKRDRSYLLAGAVALTLDADVLDPRDVYLVLAVLFDAGTRLSYPLDDTLKTVARHGTPRREKVIVDGFVLGPDYMKSIESMGVDLEETPQGPVYKVRLF